MADVLRDILQRAQTWVDEAHAAGWLTDADRRRFDEIERQQPGDLFVNQDARPLVVALFGGTGVGKSSLLNRLAGAEIARVGEVRPTSRDVTLYVHRDVELADLPDTLPTDACQIMQHDAPRWRDILWIDAPDIDSTEADNRTRALAWLPHVDLVCYVVSPERYRDDVGWRVLLERGGRHGWLFVMNRWDVGDPQQADDFERMLGEAGFESPILLRTCCRTDNDVADQFDQIEATLTELRDAHAVRELTRLGQRARLQSLRNALNDLAGRLGNEAAWTSLTEHAQQRWEVVAEALTTGTEWSLRTTAGRLAHEDGGTLRRLGAVMRAVRKSDDTPVADDEGDLCQLDERIAHLWDDWSQAKIVAWLDEVEVSASRAGLGAAAVRRQLDTRADEVAAVVIGRVQDGLRAALAHPGTFWSRFLRPVTGFMMSFLPVVALFWVAYQVYRGYHHATQGQSPFFGTEFLIHSGLVVALAWLLPFLLDRWLRPSMERAALDGMRGGLLEGVGAAQTILLDAVHDRAAEADRFRQRLRKLTQEIAGGMVRRIDARSTALLRVVARGSGSRTDADG